MRACLWTLVVRTSRGFLKSNSRRVEEVALQTVNEMANLFLWSLVGAVGVSGHLGCSANWHVGDGRGRGGNINHIWKRGGDRRAPFI